MVIEENITRLRAEIPGHIKIVAVSKTMPAGIIQEAYNAGHRAFGENKVQELTEKHPKLPADIAWHMIGHLQTNKVKYIVPFVSCIQSVDSLKLLEEIQTRAAQAGRIIDCLLQIHIAQEESKHGMSYAEAAALPGFRSTASMDHVRINGMMGIATLTGDMEQV